MPTCSLEDRELEGTARKHGTVSIGRCHIGRQQTDARVLIRFGSPWKYGTFAYYFRFFQVLREVSDYSPDLALPAPPRRGQPAFRFAVSQIEVFIPLVRESIDLFFELGRNNPKALTDFAAYLLFDSR